MARLIIHPTLSLSLASASVEKNGPFHVGKGNKNTLALNYISSIRY